MDDRILSRHLLSRFMPVGEFQPHTPVVKQGCPCSCWVSTPQEYPAPHPPPSPTSPSMPAKGLPPTAPVIKLQACDGAGVPNQVAACGPLNVKQGCPCSGRVCAPYSDYALRAGSRRQLHGVLRYCPHRPGQLAGRQWDAALQIPQPYVSVHGPCRTLCALKTPSDHKQLA